MPRVQGKCNRPCCSYKGQASPLPLPAGQGVKGQACPPNTGSNPYVSSFISACTTVSNKTCWQQWHRGQQWPFFELIQDNRQLSMCHQSALPFCIQTSSKSCNCGDCPFHDNQPALLSD
ncbi:unnamed protein product [Chondrus crispus]|uniref:Uncharacterized protein n=1 Tax=Chondrus crispus TaxID=2769 RepID=R7Q4E1_CHOCR|nr:unnamed protein product [Chondrus crispus]CDF32738.1 unnamed protein product [Chondrus crispus]|eukprot:XP_005712509.1 unnamed protein product [Chondrus crispus]